MSNIAWFSDMTTNQDNWTVLMNAAYSRSNNDRALATLERVLWVIENCIDHNENNCNFFDAKSKTGASALFIAASWGLERQVTKLRSCAMWIKEENRTKYRR